MKQIMTAIRMLLVLTLVTGVLYPLLVTGIAQLAFPEQANGSLIIRDAEVVGSELIGQQTDNPAYFWWRPSAVNYMQGSSQDNLGSSGATNYSWTNTTLASDVAQRATTFQQDNLLNDAVVIPSEILFASGSGLDPHISPDAAYLQVTRVASARGLDEQLIMELVDRFVESPQLGFLGEPRVNVLLLNLALDELE